MGQNRYIDLDSMGTRSTTGRGEKYSQSASFCFRGDRIFGRFGYVVRCIKESMGAKLYSGYCRFEILWWIEYGIEFATEI